MKLTQSLLFVLLAPALAAQADMEQRPTGGMPPERIEARPEGGFSKSISGKWNCGEFGTMTLNDKSGKVTGSYTYKKGSVTGTVKDGVFRGTWKQAKGKGQGSFEFKVSIERMTPAPTNLRGKWKNKGEADWQESTWDCAR